MYLFIYSKRNLIYKLINLLEFALKLYQQRKMLTKQKIILSLILFLLIY